MKLLHPKTRHERRRSPRRIAAARVIREFPRALAYLERGDIHLLGSTVSVHWTPSAESLPDGIDFRHRK